MGEFAARASSIALIGILAAVCSAQTGKVGKIALLSDAASSCAADARPRRYRVSLDDGTTSASCGCARAFRPRRKRTLQMWSTRNWPSRRWWASCISERRQ